jgi:hypothetical protein
VEGGVTNGEEWLGGEGRGGGINKGGESLQSHSIHGRVGTGTEPD